jgi:subtilisin family serine protease
MLSSRMPFQFETGAPPPERLSGYVSVRSQGGKSAFSAKKLPKSANPFRAKASDRRQAAKNLSSAGLTVVSESQLGYAIAGPPRAFEELSGGKVITVERLMRAESGRERYVTHVDIVGDKQPTACGHGQIKTKTMRLEGVLLERPRMLQGIFPSPIAPTVEHFHLRVPDDVAVGMAAPMAHRAGRFGEGVNVTMVDSGQYPHPFFAAHQYDVRPTITVIPGTSPTQDPVGHGTGESANIFAVAPGASLQAIRASNHAGKLVGAIAGFLAAKQGAPAIITNSWGGDGPFPPPGPPDQFDIVWALEILDAIENGIVVVFSAGNGSFTIEPQVPGVIAAGGAYITETFDLRASNYASGYESPWIANRTVPDACGLVGLLPRAQYLMLPLQPGCEIDIAESQPTPFDPDDDGTAANDGWALFSGTSAAAPQLAGVAALILGARPGLTPAQVRQAMTATATDVRTGSCHPRFNNPATVGHDQATGHGLVNASAAVQFAIDNF